MLSKMIQNLSIHLTSITLLAGCLALETARANTAYPTLWQLENQSKQSILLTCQGKAQGLASPIILPLKELGPTSQDTYTWVGWHNDGLGLNAAAWTCTLKNKDTGSETQPQFQTPPGQNSLIVIRTTGSQLELIRLDASKETTAQSVTPVTRQKR